MAKFFKSAEYEIKLFDHVWVCVDKLKDLYIQGTVQSLENFPDSIWVETGVPGLEWKGDNYDLLGYRRWEITLDQIDFNSAMTDSTKIEDYKLDIQKGEDMEFVYEDDSRTRKVTDKYQTAK